MADHPDTSIVEIIKRAQQGDQSAVAALYELYVDRIYRYLAYRVTERDVEDLTADVFVRMVTSIRSYVMTGAPFEAWLYRIAATRVADYYRRRSRTEITELDEQVSDNELLPEEEISQQQESEAVRAALRHLSGDEQTLLLLRFVEHKSHKEVAEILGKSVAAIRTMQHRALLRLAEHLDSSGKERHYLRGFADPELPNQEEEAE